MHAPQFSRPNRKSSEPVDPLATMGILDQDSFRKILHLEQKRTERSQRRFVLMLIESDNLLTAGNTQQAFEQVLSTLAGSTRETDITGWYKAGTVVGVIFTEIGPSEGKCVAGALLSKVNNALSSNLSIEQINQIRISFRVFPEDWDGEDGGNFTGHALYPETVADSGPKKTLSQVKRLMDVFGSLLAIIFLSPVLALIAIGIKLTSRGPVLFRQKRVGQYGKRFTFLKFRSMHTANDSAIHEEFVKSLITGQKDTGPHSSTQTMVYKIAKDPRVTPLGKFLRRTSLDELPQFFNVLSGEMSLVGPRPPIPYEVRHYQIWHRRRLLAVKPGITGLWQVEGRSRVGFDEMVRLDLRYANAWSLWLDIKILFRTPLAVLGGEGAR